MSLAAKLQIKGDQVVRLVNAPDGFTLEAATTRAKSAEVLLVFANDRAELAKVQDVVADHAKVDRLTWLAYPKAGQLGTDLNRDFVWRLFQGTGTRPVRQVALDETWSALRFRPDAPGAGRSRTR